MNKIKTNIKSLLFTAVLLLVSSNSYSANESNNESCKFETSNNSEQIEKKETSVFKEDGYNKVYQFINNHEYLVTLFADAVAGGVICGPWCAAAGGMAGIIDEVGISFGFVDKHYTTYGIFGAVTGHIVKPGAWSAVAGFICGILLPTGALNNQKHMIYPVVSNIAGSSNISPSGSSLKKVAGLLDEVLIDYGISNKHYLTFGTIGITLTDILGYFNPLVSSLVGTILGSIAANYENEIIGSFLAPAVIADKLYATYSKFIAKKDLNVHIEKQVIATVGCQFLIHVLSLKVADLQQGLTYNFERLDNPDGPAWRNFKSGLTNVAIFLFPYIIGEIVSNTVNNYFGKKLQFTLEDKIQAELFAKENLLRLSHDGNSTVLIDKHKLDTANIVDSGAYLLTNSVSSLVNGIYGVGIVIISSPNIFVYSALYDQACSFISHRLINQKRKYWEKIATMESDLDHIYKHDFQNIRTIIERDGASATTRKIRQITTSLREYEGAQNLWNMANNMWSMISGVTDYIFNYLLVGIEINQGRVLFNNRRKTQIANSQALKLLSWPRRNLQIITIVDQSLERINTLAGKIQMEPDKKDQINRATTDENQLILQDLAVSIENRTLVNIKDLRLDMGKAYAITGETGCGKTSLLSKIKGLKENGVAGKGYIYYPKINGKDPKIVMLSQQEYFPLNASLEEVLYYPEEPSTDPIISKNKKEEMASLLKEVGLHAFKEINANPEVKNINDKNTIDLNSKKNWYTDLSGGEKKKVTIVSAIIKKPDILILDEIFNGLDQQSIITVKQVLKKYLPNTLILVVDHHAENDDQNFYAQRVHFIDKEIVLTEVENVVAP